MPATFKVLEAEKTADKPDRGYGPMQTIRLKLENDTGTPMVAEWYTKATTQVPAAGSSVFGDVNEGQYGLSFKKAQQAGGYGGGSKDFKADPVKQAAIAVQASQKVAVDILRLAIESGAYKPPDERPVGEMTGVVRTIAQSLYGQITEAIEQAK